MTAPAAGSPSPIRRITMFKVPDAENQKKLVEAYQVLAKAAQRGGQPYILSAQAHVVAEDLRSKAYTVVAETQFAKECDMEYYDTEDPAHMALKGQAGALGVTEPPLTVFYKA